MPAVVLLHHVFAVEHLVADFAGVELLAVLLLVLGQVAVGGEEARADVALERLVIWSGGTSRSRRGQAVSRQANATTTRAKEQQDYTTCPAIVEL